MWSSLACRFFKKEYMWTGQVNLLFCFTRSLCAQSHFKLFETWSGPTQSWNISMVCDGLGILDLLRSPHAAIHTTALITLVYTFNHLNSSSFGNQPPIIFSPVDVVKELTI